MKKYLGVTAILIALLFFSGCGRAGGDDGEATSKVPVEVVTVEKGAVEIFLELSGDVSAESSAALVSKVGGTVSSVEVKVGDRVEKGALLVTLESKEMSAQVQQAEAAMAQARAGLASTRDVALPKRTEQLRAALEQTEINYNNALTNLERMERLYEEDIISRVDYENVQRSYELAESQYQSAQEQFRLETEGLALEVAALEAQVNQAQAGLETAKVAYSNTRVTSPISGTVTMISARVGSETAPGAPLITVVDLEQIYVEAKITERLLHVLKDGLSVGVTFPGNERVYEGVVGEISLSPVIGTRSYLMKVYFEADSMVRLGQMANLQVLAEKVEDVIVIPRSAVLEKEGQNRVMVVEDGRARERLIELGMAGEETVEVKKGLTPGEKLVVKGQHFLHDQAEVEIVGGEVS